MRSVGLKTLKNKLSEYVRLAAGGEVVLITDRERVVAELGPPAATRATALSDAMLADAFRAGLVTPPLRHEPPPPTDLVGPLDAILAGLAADRADR